MLVRIMNETVPPCHMDAYVGGSQFREQISRVLLQNIVFYILHTGTFIFENQIASSDSMSQSGQSGHYVPSDISVGPCEQYVQFIHLKNVLQENKRGKPDALSEQNLA